MPRLARTGADPIFHYLWRAMCLLHDLPIRSGERSVISDFRIAIAKELSMLDHFRYLRRHHVLPGGVVLLDSF